MYPFRENQSASTVTRGTRARRRRQASPVDVTADKPPQADLPPRDPRFSAAMLPLLRAQAINVNRHAAALRPFKQGEFGTGASAPTEGHVRAVNELIKMLRSDLLRMTRRVTDTVEQSITDPSTVNLQRVVTNKERTVASPFRAFMIVCGDGAAPSANLWPRMVPTMNKFCATPRPSSAGASAAIRCTSGRRFARRSASQALPAVIKARASKPSSRRAL